MRMVSEARSMQKSKSALGGKHLGHSRPFGYREPATGNRLEGLALARGSDVRLSVALPYCSRGG